ncbi:SIR2 family protein [Methylobacterium sp. Leaf86]|uniref:SIR2 family protein n=1 Tax=Methylobacterium sp. Leaf86 TaxID=1736242 RepID=UPI001910F366|nr:SIR2 family protein [Methylobacterium sp. Leaf86]
MTDLEPKPTKLAQYAEDVKADIATTVEGTACQPILFIGSGLSRRYFSAPSWDELLSRLAAMCPLIDREYAYYKQTMRDPLKIGAHFAERFQEWAWGEGRSNFPPELFADTVPSSAYIKHCIAEMLRSVTPTDLAAVSAFKDEIDALMAIRPHAVITTNYDQFLEVAFPEYQPIIGQQIIRTPNLSVGEIFKIHGCVSDPGSVVLTQVDYDEFIKKKKYLSAKLLTFFSEHPLLFIGYGAGDPNIRAILSDIDEALPTSGGVIPNVYILEWRDSIPEGETPATEKLIAVEDAKSVRIKAIEATDFTWVFKAFGTQQPLNGVSPKTLRALLSRSYELVRTDIPRKMVQADFKMLEGAVQNGDEFAKLFGITTVNEASAMGANYPHTLTDVCKKLGGKGWARAQQGIDMLKAHMGFDLKASDNRYHCAIKYGKNPIHKYSDEAVGLLSKVLAGEAVEVDIPGQKEATLSPPRPPRPPPRPLGS